MKKYLALLLIIVSCAPTQSTTMNTDSINGTWKLNLINKELPKAIDYPNGIPELTFNIADKQVYGSTGCNRVSGSFTLGKENSLSFLPLATTRMYCPGDGEQRFLELLQSVSKYKLESDKLALLHEEKEVLYFSIVK